MNHELPTNTYGSQILDSVKAQEFGLTKQYERLTFLMTLKPQVEADIQAAIVAEHHYGRPAGHIRILQALAFEWPGILRDKDLWEKKFHRQEDPTFDTNFFYEESPENARIIMRTHTCNARRYLEKHSRTNYYIQNIRAEGLMLASTAELDQNSQSTRPEITRIAHVQAQSLSSEFQNMLAMATETVFTPHKEPQYTRLADRQFLILIELLKQFGQNIDYKQLGRRHRIGEKEIVAHIQGAGRWIRKLKLPYIVGIASNIDWVYIKNK